MVSVSTLNKILNDNSLSKNERYYWGYQYRFGKEVLIPYFKKNHIRIENAAIVEIGCAEGGVLAALIQNGGGFGLGTDIVEPRLQTGRKMNASLALNINLQKHGIFQDAIRNEWKERFDLLILRDVIEHLDNPELALQNISGFLNQNGRVLVSFPPYTSPYGAHQHTLKNFWGYIPFLHYLPDPIFNWTIKTGRKADIEEVKRLRQIQLTIDKFKIAALNAGMQIEKESYYLLRPVFKMKFGIPELSLTPGETRYVKGIK
ncbi:Methyltransferase type 12 [Chloroherpeton thalassium ATCC 35110]|uniref:Methyltransferase type 12 n=1 Tax=Chloroherpeton thalassium (strain ATCC 35110 / GB-78) TaxID=517418 RepID=B3QWI5_CHLT3|nr:class I SAM-dependent methyltransferase [Chloroherpeton thalassium]ACF14745.1 Methyltransferase type 12 [Chloroherpeton thalassium ATCC 35110]